MSRAESKEWEQDGDARSRVDALKIDALKILGRA